MWAEGGGAGLADRHQPRHHLGRQCRGAAKERRPGWAGDDLEHVAATRVLAPVRSTVDVGAIGVPTLFVDNKDDACVATPYAAVPALMAKFTHAPRKELITVSGGSPPQSEPCEALSRHGYIGIEDEVVGNIVAWIKG